MSPPAWAGPLLELLGGLLGGTGIDDFEALSRLPFLLLAAVAVLLWSLRGRPAAIPFPGMDEIRAAGGRRLEWTPAVARALRAGALVCIALVLCDPVSVHEAPPEPGHGLDLMLVVDTSASMRALDTAFGSAFEAAPAADPEAPAADPEADAEGPEADAPVPGGIRTRLDLAREAVSRFARRRVAEGDRAGLVVFGSTATTWCPLTSDGGVLAAALERVEVGVAGEATALGDALALAVRRLPESDEGGGTGAGRVVVLLTDGRSNAGGVPVDVATQIARTARLRVHTVGIGTGGGPVPVAPRPGSQEPGLRFERHDTDPASLRRIADLTGGRYFPVTGSSDLQAVYDEIDALERIPRPLPPRVQQTPRPEPLLAGAGGLLALEIALAGILRRRVP